MRESRSSGSVGERGGNEPLYPDDCFKIMKANCICIHEESDEERRLDIEKDLVANYSPPCNG